MNEIICPHCKKAFKLDEADFVSVSDEELVELKRKSRRNPGWVASRAYYETALTEELLLQSVELGKRIVFDNICHITPPCIY